MLNDFVFLLNYSHVSIFLENDNNILYLFQINFNVYLNF